MTSRLRIVLLLTALLLPASLALASGAPSTPPPAAAAALPPLAFSAAAPLCPRTVIPTFLPAFQPLSTDICNACSDTACLGKEEHSECAPGFRCLAGPACTNAGPSCLCKIIGLSRAPARRTL
jgi:hypothetical protein